VGRVTSRGPADTEALLAQLVAFPTVAGEPNQPLIEFVQERLERHGARVTVTPSDWRPDGYNLHAELGPAQDGGILLAAHTDVVAAEEDDWTSDPFEVRRADGRLYGRGTTDMKGFIAAVLAAVAGASVRDLREPLQIALSCDEELGCKGVGALLEQLAAAPGRPSLCVIGEPTLMRVADRHKGKVALRVEVRGRPAHSSVPARGVNAVTFAARLIAELDELAQSLSSGPGDESFAVPHATLSVGPIHGGVALNIVPDRCTFDVELRYPPGDTPERLVAPIRSSAEAIAAEMKTMAPEAGIELVEIASYPPLRPSADGVATMAELGVCGDTIAVDFGTEAGFYSDCLQTPCVICGPGDMRVAHRADEYVEREQLEAAEQFVSRVIARLSEGARVEP
jgi:acetylornithine deacetylase